MRDLSLYEALAAAVTLCTVRRSGPAGRRRRAARKHRARRTAARARVEYDRIYNQLKRRKDQGKISIDEWNAAVVQAMQALEQTGCGELTDDEMRTWFQEI